MTPRARCARWAEGAARPWTRLAYDPRHSRPSPANGPEDNSMHAWTCETLDGADALRDRVRKLGYEITDTAEGPRVVAA